MKKIAKIVLTGGPCGGKTSSLKLIKKALSEQGYNVGVIEEVATELLNKGITPDSVGRKIFQKMVLQWQIEKEQICERNLEELNGLGVIICDRGTLDGQAFCEMYWREGDGGKSGKDLFESIAEELEIDKNDIFLRYDKIIHFLSTAVDIPEAFAPETNLMRHEDIKLSIEADEILQEIWSVHPNRVILDNSTDFAGKVNRAINEIESELEVNKEKGEGMEDVLSKNEAIKIIEEYAKMLMERGKDEVSGVFMVGSLADGNYVPGKSDLDVSVIIKNDAEAEEVEKISSEIINFLVSKYNIKIDFEAFIKKEKMLFPPYYPEEQKTVELMRIKNQAKLLQGSFDQASIPEPLDTFFILDEKYAESKLEKKLGKDFISKMSAKQRFNYIVNYMRFKNYLDNGEFKFNKKEIISEYMKDESKREHMLEILDDKDKEKYADYIFEFAKECKARKQEIVNPNLGENHKNR